MNRNAAIQGGDVLEKVQIFGTAEFMSKTEIWSDMPRTGGMSAMVFAAVEFKLGSNGGIIEDRQLLGHRIGINES